MSKQPDDHITSIISEIIKIDPELERYRADLPNLITALLKERPNVVPSEAFITSLRAQLLNHRPAPTPAKQAGPQTFFWWATRLTPIGIALLLLVILIPKQTIAPVELPTPTEENTYDTDLQRTMKTPDQTTGDETFSTMMAPPSTADSAIEVPVLDVIPPSASTKLTIRTLNVPEAGWLVVFEDQGGSFGEQLGAQYFKPGEYRDLELSLLRPLQYPELITIALYTGVVTTQFEILQESLQLDPALGQPILVTVPVVSELELEFTP